MKFTLVCQAANPVPSCKRTYRFVNKTVEEKDIIVAKYQEHSGICVTCLTGGMTETKKAGKPEVSGRGRTNPDEMVTVRCWVRCCTNTVTVARKNASAAKCDDHKEVTLFNA